MGFDDMMKFVVEKLKEFLQTIENLGGEALQWFDQVFPPETREDTISHWFQVALPFLIAAVVLTLLICCCCGGRIRLLICCRRCCGCGCGRRLLTWCRRCCWCCCGGGRRWRTMKAPGRNCRMPRDVFETNPRSYFRNLRSHPGDQLV